MTWHSNYLPITPGTHFLHSPTHYCGLMASQMRGLRHQNAALKASADQIRQLLRPLVKAYVLGYASSTTPRLLTLFVSLVTKSSKDGGERKLERALFGVYGILRGGFEWQRFPTFCAALIGGASLLQVRPSITYPCPDLCATLL